MRPKVFGIGFHKTGTSSLRDALTMLGYSVTGPNGVRDPNISENALPMALKLASEFDAFRDNPWPILFREMDAAFPGSRFVLTIRDPLMWISSAVTHFGTKHTPMREWIYGHGSPIGHEDVYLDVYNRHNEAVRAHFAGRDDLLIIDVTIGQGWPELCGFLDCAMPTAPFPHSNPRSARPCNPVAG
ncbi:MAG: sulfotransferase [Mesorhizobium sp.]|nr:sulfotransferase [Mesorhizobium sp.]